MASGLTNAGLLQRVAIGIAVLAAFGSGLTVVVFGLLLVGLVISIPRPAVLWGGAGLVIVLSTLRPATSSAVAVGLLVVYAMAVLADQPGRSLTDKQSRIGFCAAGAALLIVSLLSAFRFNPPSNTGEGRSTFERQPREQSEPGEGLLARLADAIRRFFRQGESGEPATPGQQVEPTEPPTQSDINWWRVIIVAAVILLLIALAVLLWRWLKRRKETIEAMRPDWAVRRLDKVGSRAVRDRRASETPFSYGNDIDQAAGDGRLEHAGGLVSDFLYRPTESGGSGSSSDDLRSKLDDLEGRPPQRIRKRPIADRFRWRRRRD